MTIPRLMLVDDDPNLRRVLQLQLEAAGYHVTCADSGPAALKELEESRFDVVITDIQMPGMDGLELLERIKERDPDAVIVVITAFGDVDRAVRALKAGAFDFLTKPISQEVLLGTLVRARNFRRLYFSLARQREALQERCSSMPSWDDRQGCGAPSIWCGEPRRGTPRSYPGRDRHRQGAVRAGAPSRISPTRRSLPQPELRRHPREPIESGSSATRRGPSPGPAHPTRLLEEAHEARSSWTRSACCRSPCRGRSCACWRPGSAARRRERGPQLRRSGRGGHEQSPRGDDLQWELPQGSLLPALRAGGSPAAVARASGRSAAPHRSPPRRSRIPHVRLDPEALEALEACAWPETSASCATCWSGR